MIKLTNEEVLHIAKLARLDISVMEVEKYRAQLSSVINYFSELEKVETKGVSATSQTTGLENVFRQDLPNGENCLAQDSVLSGSDKTYNGFFKVKAVLTERTDK